MSNVSASIGLPLACAVFAALVVVEVLVWRKVTKSQAPTGSPEARSRRLRAAGAAIGVGIVAILLGQPFTDAAPRSFAAWFLVVLVSFGPMIIAAALLGRWANRVLGEGALLQIVQGAGRPLTQTERSVGLRFVVAVIVWIVLLSLVFKWSIHHIVF